MEDIPLIPDSTDLPELPGIDDWAGDLQQPYDDTPTFDAQANPEIDTVIRLEGDRRFVNAPNRRLFHDYRSNPDAYRHLDPLPGPCESLHGIISGKYALFELIPAIIENAGIIQTLHIATLSFNKQNAADLLGLLDDGHVKSVSLLVSYYFKSTSPEIYAALVPQLRERGQKVLAMRTHCKLILAEMENGTKYTVESSANLRSSVNIEQFVMSNDAGLYDFHRHWMDNDLLTKTDLGDKPGGNDAI